MTARAAYSIFLAVFHCFFMDPLAARERCDRWVAKIVSVQGQVEVIPAGNTRWQRVSLDDTLCAGDRIQVQAKSRAALVLSNQTLLRLDANTTVTLSEITPDKPSWLRLLEGAIHFISRTPSSLRIRTPFVNAGLEGTEFVVRVEPNQAEIWVIEGEILATNSRGSLTLTSGQAAVAPVGEAPMRRLAVRPFDAVQWALYYPPIIDFRLAAYPRMSRLPQIGEALVAARENDFAGAAAKLDAVPVTRRGAQYYSLRGALVLSVGAIEDARDDIARALALDPSNGTAHALQSVIAVTQNKPDQALRLARQAVELDPESAVPHVALSYAYQAMFDIDNARESAKRAVAMAPNNGLAHARLSELELSRGYLDRARDAAESAAALDPDLGRTQTVLGFAHLTEINIDQALSAFEEAIRLDPAGPLPRLGLGLAKIRQSNLAEGSREIEIAASLDPNHSVIRSYLGKAYYEQKRTAAAQTEFAIAKELDPLDPTPWFYDAILKQTINRPVEALRDIQRAIELNDNRAVFRSRLLLDEDLAARSASLGRTYNDLGFQSLGLLEGWKAVNTDPSNFSAHRLLADLYGALPGHETARLSELLQAQLLQPLNMTPVQPRIGDSDSLILGAANPGSVAFNEFTSLFTRNRLAMQATGLVGNNGTLGNEITQSGVWNNFSYSIGQSHFETDGYSFLENNDLIQDVYNLFAQVKLSPNLSVQGELRSTQFEYGALVFDLNQEGPSRSPSLGNLRNDVQANIARVGVHYRYRPDVDIIGSVIYRDGKDKIAFEPVAGFHFEFEAKTSGYIAEGQHLLKQPNLRLIAGGGYQRLESINIIDDSFSSQSERTVTKHGNGYWYSYTDYPGNVTWTIGASYDVLIEAPVGEFDQMNPKLGVTWSITPTTILRAAAFRALRRPLPTNQTIEPTQVAGFNQFFDDFQATDFTRYGLAVDRELASGLYGGLEASKRDLDLPANLPDGSVGFDPASERLYRGYLNWVISRRFAANTQYQYQVLDCRPSSFLLFPCEMRRTRTHIAPVTLKYFEPSGLFASIGATYVKQEAEPSYDFIQKRSDRFGIVDFGIGYRLPKRRGIISFAINNVFDKRFGFQVPLWNRQVNEQPRLNLGILPFAPERVISAQVTVAF